jgi:hypothetical protein
VLDQLRAGGVIHKQRLQLTGAGAVTPAEARTRTRSNASPDHLADQGRGLADNRQGLQRDRNADAEGRP